MDAIYYGTIISVITILVNLLISLRTIHTNREIQKENAKINAENAGKNRIIYGVEVMRENDKSNLKIKLESGNYTILNAYAEPAALTSNTVVVLGKIKP